MTQSRVAISNSSASTFVQRRLVVVASSRQRSPCPPTEDGRKSLLGITSLQPKEHGGHNRRMARMNRVS